MATHDDDFSVYDASVPAKIRVCCAPGFRIETGKLFRTHAPASDAWFANINELVKRFARGEQLSTASFRKEDIGYAFRSGALRFYGAFSSRHLGYFVLSHAIIKQQQKLADVDIKRMKDSRDRFDALESPTKF